MSSPTSSSKNVTTTSSTTQESLDLKPSQLESSRPIQSDQKLLHNEASPITQRATGIQQPTKQLHGLSVTDVRASDDEQPARNAELHDDGVKLIAGVREKGEENTPHEPQFQNPGNTQPVILQNPYQEQSQPLSLDFDASTPENMQRKVEVESKVEHPSKDESPSESTARSRLSTPSPPPPPPPKDHVYLDPTPKTPLASSAPSRTPSRGGDRGDLEGDELELSSSKPPNLPSHSTEGEEGNTGRESQQPLEEEAEIQSIMEQFDEEGGGPGEEEVMSPRLEIASPFMQHPPRKSSLEPIRPIETQGARVSGEKRSPESARNLSTAAQTLSLLDSDISPPVPEKPNRIEARSSNAKSEKPLPSPSEAVSPSSFSTKQGLPEPDPEPDLPFDFHRFLEQLRHRSADPVAGFLRSFLNGFGRKQWMVHEQVKFVSDFLTFITNKMAQCEIWKDVSDAEFDNAREGMEKLVMNRLYSQTFSPAIPPALSAASSRGKAKQVEKPNPGRRGQHQEDVERDEILAQKVQIYGWIEEKHLDIPPVGVEGKRFLRLAQQELLKIKGYRAPRDKIICVLNCCKVIFGLLRKAGSDSSADAFVPLLILVVLQANPDHLVSNVQYILRFRNQDKLVGEAGYYLSSLMGAVQFIENLDRTTLTIEDDDFEKNVETAVSAIAEKHKKEEAHQISSSALISEKPENTEALSQIANDPQSRTKRPSYQLNNSTDGSHDSLENNLAPAALLRTIQKPLSSIGRMFTDELHSEGGSLRPSLSQRPVSSLGLSPPKSEPSPPSPQRISAERVRDTTQRHDSAVHSQISAQDAAARQASAEAAQARRIQQAEHKTVIETLTAMFPNLDKDVIDDVVRMKEGRVGLAVDACLALSNS